MSFKVPSVTDVKQQQQHRHCRVAHTQSFNPASLMVFVCVILFLNKTFREHSHTHWCVCVWSPSQGRQHFSVTSLTGRVQRERDPAVYFYDEIHSAIINSARVPYVRFARLEVLPT